MYDFLLGIRHWMRGIGTTHLSMLLHHVVITSVLYAGLSMGYGTLHMSAIVTNELTTPFLHLRWMLYLTPRWRDTWLSFASALAFVALFFLVRICLGIAFVAHLTIGVVRYWHGLVAHLPVYAVLLLPILAYAHLALNLYWFSLIVRFGMQRATRSTTPSPSGSTSLTALSDQPGGTTAKEAAVKESVREPALVLHPSSASLQSDRPFKDAVAATRTAAKKEKAQ